MKKRMLLIFAIVGLGILSGIGRAQPISALPTNKIKNEQQARSVKNRVLTSTEMPAARFKFGKKFRYVGSQSFILYNVARAEQHFFVDADEKGRIKRFYWVQFEGYLPDNTKIYDYRVTKTVSLGGLEFIAEASARNIKDNLGPPDSDGNRARTFLENKSYRMASDETISQRLVHLVDKEKRNELMIIYIEDLSPKQLTAADVMEGGSAAVQWNAISKELLERAMKDVKILR